MSCFSSSYFISLPLLLFYKAPGRGGGLNVLVCLALLWGCDVFVVGWGLCVSLSLPGSGNTISSEGQEQMPNDRLTIERLPDGLLSWSLGLCQGPCQLLVTFCYVKTHLREGSIVDLPSFQKWMQRQCFSCHMHLIVLMFTNNGKF